MRVRRSASAALIATLAALAASTPPASADTTAAAPPTCVPSDTVTCPAPAAAPAPGPPPDEILSNETTFTTWATPLNVTAVRRNPSLLSPRAAMLHLSTEDGYPEVYIVLRQRQVGTRTWSEIRLPMKPAGRTGWVPRAALDTYNRVDTELVLNRTTERIRLYRGGRKVFEAPAGVGAPGTPTPVGPFWIREAFRVSGIGAYGPFAFGTSAYSSLTDWPGGGVVGLHGTDQPQLVPGRPSHGCIRLRNSDILRLSHLVPVGTPLLVQ